jgi:hypothetical protein
MSGWLVFDCGTEGGSGPRWQSSRGALCALEVVCGSEAFTERLSLDGVRNLRSIFELGPGSRRLGANLEGPRVGVCSISGWADLASEGGR